VRCLGGSTNENERKRLPAGWFECGFSWKILLRNRTVERLVRARVELMDAVALTITVDRRL
jgi:hypothetical protein